MKPSQGSAVITVNTAALYDQLDVNEEISDALKRGMVIVDTVLIYDEAGHLVTKLGAKSSTLNPLTIDASGLSNGTYTLVAIQSSQYGVNPVWILDGEELLSTVNVTTPFGQLDASYVIGYASATVTVDGGTIEATVTPQSLGSLVEVVVDNFDESLGYKQIPILGARKEKYVVGCYLDPSLSAAERKIMEKDNYGEGLGIIMPEVGRRVAFTLSVDEDLIVSLYGEKEDGTFEFICEDDYPLTAGQRVIFYADFKQLSWQPPFYGTLEDFAAWKAERDAGILDFYPCINWGCNVDEVRQYVQSRQWWANDIPELTQYYDNRYWYTSWFCAYNTVEHYCFTTPEGENLQRVVIRCFNLNLSFDVIHASLIKQGYEYAGKIYYPGYEPRDIFFSADGQTEVQFYLGGVDHIAIDYQPTDPDDFQYIVSEEDPIIVH